MSEFMYWHVRRPLQWLPYWIAAKMPKWLVYHCAIRLIVAATTGKYGSQNVPELTAMDALKRWDDVNGNATS